MLLFREELIYLFIYLLNPLSTLEEMKYILKYTE